MRGGGIGTRALDDIFEFTGVTDHDWRALECARANGLAISALFERTCPGDPEYGSWVKSLKPEVIIGNTSRRTNELEEGPQQGTAEEATIIVQSFNSSQAHLLMLESTPYLLMSETWTADLSPLLSTTGYCWKAVEMSAQQVGAPSTKRTFVACVRNHPSAEERLIRWKARRTAMRVQLVTLGEFVGREAFKIIEQGAG